MTTISPKSSFLAMSALALLMAGVALSVPNSVGAANLITYDFEFKYTDIIYDPKYKDTTNIDHNIFGLKETNTSIVSGFITVDKDNTSASFSNSEPFSDESSIWYQPKWVDFSFTYLGRTYTKADVDDTPSSSYLQIVDIPKDSSEYIYYGSFNNVISALIDDGRTFYGRNNQPISGRLSLYGNNTEYNRSGGFVDNKRAYSFKLRPRAVTLTPRAVPVPSFAFGIVAAGGWLASKQLRRKSQTAKQSVSV